MTELDKKNIKLIELMEKRGEICKGLEDGNVPITLRNLIDDCEKYGIDLDSPLFLECPDGYFPLEYYHGGVSVGADGTEYRLGVLVLSDGCF